MEAPAPRCRPKRSRTASGRLAQASSPASARKRRSPMSAGAGRAAARSRAGKAIISAPVLSIASSLRTNSDVGRRLRSLAAEADQARHLRSHSDQRHELGGGDAEHLVVPAAEGRDELLHLFEPLSGNGADSRIGLRLGPAGAQGGGGGV